MTNYTERLDKALRVAAWAHQQAGQHRKGTDIPYIIHPFGVMTIASGATDDEDTLIACLLHDVLEDVPASLYSEARMRDDFGDHVVEIVQAVTKDDSIVSWHARSEAYLQHLLHEASDEAVIVAASDKIHNIQSTLTDFKEHGEALWQRFGTKNAADQVWWYESVLEVMRTRNAPTALTEMLATRVDELKANLL